MWHAARWSIQRAGYRSEKCRGCRRCAHECGSDAITHLNGKAVIDYDKWECDAIGACSFDAVYNENSCANELLTGRWQNAMAVVRTVPASIPLVQDISPNCDCHGENDALILPDIGMFASFDPVALDQACGCSPAATDRKQPAWRTSGKARLASSSRLFRIPTEQNGATLISRKIGLGTRA
ncbi:MAG: DUF362 domain-containing protein [Gallintestinimicrobium sp.]